MPKTAKDYEQQALKAINDNDLVFIDELLEFLPIGRTTLYNLGVNSLDTIKEALELNKTKRKRRIRNQWEKETNNTGLQIAYYRLLATPDELARLSPANHNSAPSEPERMPPPQITFVHGDNRANTASDGGTDKP